MKLKIRTHTEKIGNLYYAYATCKIAGELCGATAFSTIKKTAEIKALSRLNEDSAAWSPEPGADYLNN